MTAFSIDSRIHSHSPAALARQVEASQRGVRGLRPSHEDRTVDARRRWRAIQAHQCSASSGSPNCHAEEHWTDSLVEAETDLLAAVDACRSAACSIDPATATARNETLNEWILDMMELLQQRLRPLSGPTTSEPSVQVAAPALDPSLQDRIRQLEELLKELQADEP